MNMEEIYQSIEHIAKCEMYDAIEVKYLKSKFEELQQQCKKQKEVIDKLELENKVLKEQMVAMVKPNYTYGVR